MWASLFVAHEGSRLNRPLRTTGSMPAYAWWRMLQLDMTVMIETVVESGVAEARESSRFGLGTARDRGKLISLFS